VRLLQPDGSVQHVVVAAGEWVLVGRHPRADRLPAQDQPAAAIRTLTVAAPSVSENHLLLQNIDGLLHLVDLGSRNGTWPKLPLRIPVAFSSTRDLTVRLAPPSNEVPSVNAPAAAVYRDPAEFPQAVAHAVEAWLNELGEDTDTELVQDEASTFQDPHAIPLPKGFVLRFRPRDTLNSTWPSRLATLWRYVETQSRHFSAEESSRFEGMILASELARQTHRQVVEAAMRGLRVLLLGPSGVGKEGLARAYHRHSGRSGPFVPLNCAELSRELFRTELFGAEEGAFTGSVRRIAGAVEQAHGGTLFLDEIGEMPLDVQAMLLRFLDRGEYTPIGRYGRSKHSDVRVVCATNRDLRTEARKGRFRQDLWFRLSIEVVRVSGLRERFDDLVAYLGARPMEGATSVLATFSPEALDVLRNHAWEGNFRELANFVERLPSPARNGSIDAQTCREALDRGSLASPVAQTLNSWCEPESSSTSTWATWSERALRAFVEDHDGRLPSNWDAVQTFVEKYLKPLLMVHLGGAADQLPSEAAGVQKLARGLADVMRADRGTAAKQLARFMERYVPQRAS
jgi:DNA-binding NtrC family response regulator